jgi:hypothetical protein
MISDCAVRTSQFKIEQCLKLMLGLARWLTAERYSITSSVGKAPLRALNDLHPSELPTFNRDRLRSRPLDPSPLAGEGK